MKKRTLAVLMAGAMAASLMAGVVSVFWCIWFYDKGRLVGSV